MRTLALGSCSWPCLPVANIFPLFTNVGSSCLSGPSNMLLNIRSLEKQSLSCRLIRHRDTALISMDTFQWNEWHLKSVALKGSDIWSRVGGHFVTAQFRPFCVGLLTHTEQASPTSFHHAQVSFVEFEILFPSVFHFF